MHVLHYMSTHVSDLTTKNVLVLDGARKVMQHRESVVSDGLYLMNCCQALNSVILRRRARTRSLNTMNGVEERTVRVYMNAIVKALLF